MKNKERKAFTLVELLAVIVILAVILVIAIPQIISVIKSARLSSIKDSAMLIAEQADKDYLSQQVLNKDYNSTSIPCTDVAKLNDDYASCSISYNNGVAIVKLKGKDGGKFSGITCKGTKDNMICKDENIVPEYVYSFGKPQQQYIYSVTNQNACKTILINEGESQDFVESVCSGNGYNGVSTSDLIAGAYQYGYTYTVKTDKTNECKMFIKQLVLDKEWVETEQEAENAANVICSNSNDIDGDGSNYSTSDWITENIVSEVFTYENISTFVSKGSNIFDSFVMVSEELLNEPVEDYKDLNKNVFIRWPGSTTNFDKNVNPEVCFTFDINNQTPVCFTQNSYSTANENGSEWSKVKEAFGTGSTCGAAGSSILVCTKGSDSCTTQLGGYLTCNVNSDSCNVDLNGNITCS